MSATGIRIPWYRLGAAGTAQTTFTAERALHDTTGAGPRPVIGANVVLPGMEREFTIYYRALGILSSTATPTYTFTLRLGTNGSTSAAIVLGTAAVTTGSGVTNQPWMLEGEISATTIADAGANSTVRGTGFLLCPGLATTLALFNASASATAPTVATVDWSIANYLNLNITCSASSASNSVQLLAESVDILFG